MEKWARLRSWRQRLCYALIIFAPMIAVLMVVADFAADTVTMRLILGVALAAWAGTLITTIGCGILERRARRDFPSMSVSDHS